MPSLTNGTEGCPGVTAVSVSHLLAKMDLPRVLRGGWGGSVRRQGPGQTWPHLWSFPAFPFYLLLFLPSLGEGMQARGRSCVVVKENRGRLETGIFSGVVENQETWVFTLALWSWTNPLISLGPFGKENEDLNYRSSISWANIFEYLLCVRDSVREKAQFLPLRSSQHSSEGLSPGLCNLWRGQEMAFREPTKLLLLQPKFVRHGKSSAFIKTS